MPRVSVGSGREPTWGARAASARAVASARPMSGLFARASETRAETCGSEASGTGATAERATAERATARRSAGMDVRHESSKRAGPALSPRRPAVWKSGELARVDPGRKGAASHQPDYSVTQRVTIP